MYPNLRSRTYTNEKVDIKFVSTVISTHNTVPTCTHVFTIEERGREDEEEKEHE